MSKKIFQGFEKLTLRPSRLIIPIDWVNNVENSLTVDNQRVLQKYKSKLESLERLS